MSAAPEATQVSTLGKGDGLQQQSKATSLLRYETINGTTDEINVCCHET